MTNRREQLRELRLEAGLSQTKMARRLEITLPRYRYIETRAKNVSVPLLMRVRAIRDDIIKQAGVEAFKEATRQQTLADLKKRCEQKIRQIDRLIKLVENM